MSKPTKTTNITKKRQIKMILIVTGLVFVGISVIGFIYERIAEAIDAKTIRPPGQIVTVDAHKMHIYCTGQAKHGEPTVILDSGAGDNWESWRKVQPEIAKHTKVCSYDRSGLGFSEAVKNSHSNAIVATELAALLKAAHVQPPYVMVGHSIGGFNIRLFTEHNKADVVGMVFVDPSLEGMQTTMSSAMTKVQLKLLYPIVKYAYATGIVRLVSTVFPGFMVPYATHNAISRAGSDTLKVITTAEKEVTVKDSDYDAVRKANNFGDIPIIVLTAQDTISTDPSSRWLVWSKELARTSSNGKQLTVMNSSHYIQIDQPKVVIDSILSEL